MDDPRELDLHLTLHEHRARADAADELVGRTLEGVPGAEVVNLPMGDVLAQPGLGLLAGARAGHRLADARMGHERCELVERLVRWKATDQPRGLDDAQRATH